MRALTLSLLLLADVSPRPAVAPGLHAEYFDIGRPIGDFPAYAKLAPALVRTDATLDFEGTAEPWKGTKLREHWAARWVGLLKIEKKGVYTLCLDSDDGARLFLNGRRIVDNPGLHPMREATGDIELTAGMHDLRVEFFENEVFAGLRFSWGLKGRPLVIVPPEALFHRLR